MSNTFLKKKKFVKYLIYQEKLSCSNFLLVDSFLVYIITYTFVNMYSLSGNRCKYSLLIGRMASD